MSRDGDVFANAVCYIPGMVQITYGVFQQADGGYAVALSQAGSLGQLATGFASHSEAQAWIDQDKWLENVDERSRPRGRARAVIAEVRLSQKAP